MNLFQIGIACEGDILTVVGAVKFVFTLIQWGIPLVLIVLGTIDMFKAMASGDEKKTKEVQKTFGRRLIYAVVAFLIPFIISLVFTFTGKMFAGRDETATANNTLADFMTCWNASGHNNGGSASDEYYCHDANGTNVGYTNEDDCENNSYIWGKK